MEWKTGLPEKSGKYVVFSVYNNDIKTYMYSSKYKMFNVSDWFEEKEAKRLNTNDGILKWVPLEEFLKNQNLM